MTSRAWRTNCLRTTQRQLSCPVDAVELLRALGTQKGMLRLMNRMVQPEL